MKKDSRSIRAVLREVGTPLLPISWLIVTIVVSLAGPFGTYDSLPLSVRFVYWGAMVALTMLIAVGLRVFLRIAVKTSSGIFEDVLVICSLGFVVGQMVRLVNHLIWPGENLVSYALVSLLAVLIGGSVCGFRRFFNRQRSDIQSDKPRDRLLDRLEVNEGARLSRISSDNHHIRIMTSDGGEHRLLMRLRDAVAEIDVEPGMFVHRSHWVAEASISRVVETGGRESVELPCGNTLPIGPKYRPNLVEAGVIGEERRR